MDRNRTVAGLDVHKDSIYLCIMGHDEAIIFEKTYGVLTPELRQMCNGMLDRGVTEAAMKQLVSARPPSELKFMSKAQAMAVAGICCVGDR